VCTDELTAFRMADWLAGAVDGYGDLAWFEEQGTIAMSGLLLAAAMTGATLAEVYQWTQRRGHERALAALAEHGNPQLHAAVRVLLEDTRTAASIRTTIARALKWAVIPQLAAAVDRGGTFNAREFALEGGTLHLIAGGDGRSVITPLLRALASYVHYEAGLAGSRTEAGRLDPPLLMAMDEVAQICPVDLPSMLADSAGKGIRFVTVGHSLAKLEERYGRDGAANIWAISGVKMLLRGITEPQTLEDVSRVCGTLGDADDSTVRIVPPDVLRRLPKHTGLVINMDLSPAIVRVSRAWKRRSVRRLIPAPLLLPVQRTGEAEVPELIELPAEAAAPIPSVNGSGPLAGTGDGRR
jgi:type IV secretion system protein VirD4